MEAYDKKSVWNILWEYAVRHRRAFQFIYLMVIVAVFAEIGQSYLFKQLVDHLTGDGSGAKFWIAVRFIGYIAIAMTVENIFFRLSGFWSLRTMPHIVQEFRADLFKYVRQHSKRYFNDHAAGNLTAKINMAGLALTRLYQLITFTFLTAGVYAMCSLYLLWHVSPWIMVSEVFLLAAYMVVVIKLIARGMPRQKGLSEARSATTGSVVDVITNMLCVISHAAQSREQAR